MKILIIIVIVLLFISMFLFLKTHWIPSVYSVSEEELLEFSDYILVKEVFYTGTRWTLIGDTNGFYQQEGVKDIALTGKKLPFSNMGQRVNCLPCIVEYEGQIDHIAFTEPVDSYRVIEWYPIYPVVRDSIWPDWMLPSKFMTAREIKYYENGNK